MDSNYSDYTDFLKDRKFIQWQLLPDNDLNIYWELFMQNHPELTEEIQKAILFLKSEGMNKNMLSVSERDELLNKIRIHILRNKKMKRRRLIWFSTAASAAIALIIIGITLFYPSSKNIISENEELIVGELLNKEDIQLITNGEAISFQNDVEVTLDEDGKAEVSEKNKEASTITFAKDKMISLSIPYGKRSTLTLSDGSKLWLNSGSILEFPSQFSGDKREIHLVSGEMYIEVAHDQNKPFLVQTDDFQVRVYGTKFNISKYSVFPKSVVLVEGSVGLKASGIKEHFITPNQQAILSDAGIFETETIDVAQLTSWKDGNLTFNKTPMNEVLQQIGRYYNLAFNFENDVNIQNRSCTGKIYLSDNLDNVMTTVSLLSSTKYEIKENKIYITN